MPMMNGFELYDKIKKLDSKVKVCFMSGFDINSIEWESNLHHLKLNVSFQRQSKLRNF
ncbi:hypothetical protein BH18THE2_BH18THE2_32280 [soil metagenome]